MSILDLFAPQNDYLDLRDIFFNDISIAGSYIKRSAQKKRRKLERQNPKRRKKRRK